jgi:hypothetical protein
MRPVPRALALAAAALLLLGLGAAAAGLSYEFESEGRRHAFRGSFPTAAERSCVLQVLYSHEHLARFVKSADAIELVREGKNWNEVRYVYDRWLVTHSETYRRWLTGGAPAIRFELVNVEHSGLPVPLPETSRGHYDLRPVDDALQVVYVQEAELGPGPLLWAHQRIARQQAIRFLEDLAEYVEAACPVGAETPAP